tara:strand:- start:16756 stop:17244 length:489 start_codon:yes stop_codon:yes gene_type:complete
MASVRTLVGTSSGGISTSGESSTSATLNALIPVEQHDILLDSTNNYYELEHNNNYYDIYNIFYDFAIFPSIILPELTDDFNGKTITIINNDALTINISVYDTSTDTIASAGMVGLSRDSDGISELKSPATSINLPPFMATKLIATNTTINTIEYKRWHTLLH